MTELAGGGAGRIDWPFVRQGFRAALLPAWFVYCSLGLILHYVLRPDTLWSDAHVYFRATEAWISGANPWEATFGSIPFAAPPPALLLNLPLLPLGETAATVVWVVGGFTAVLFLLRRFRLPIWWALWYPMIEGQLAASPDIVLAALVVAGAGVFAAATKPYSVPALAAERRWTAIAGGAVIVVVSFPLLPWGQFIDSREIVAEAFDEWAHPNSAWGEPLLMVGAAIALMLLRWERGMGLLTPAILAQQPHYAIFSLRYITTSRILAGFTTVPVYGVAALGVMIYALQDRWARRSAGPHE